MAGQNPSFDLFQRRGTSGIAGGDSCPGGEEIAPHAADVDEGPVSAGGPDALTASGFNAIHVPEEFGGQVRTR